MVFLSDVEKQNDTNFDKDSTTEYIINIIKRRDRKFFEGQYSKILISIGLKIKKQIFKITND